MIYYNTNIRKFLSDGLFQSRCQSRGFFDAYRCRFFYVRKYGVLSHIRLQFPLLPNNAEHAEAYERHDEPRYEYTCGNGEYGFFKIHIEDARGERTRPCAGAGKRYADEKHERDKKSPTRFCLKLFTRLFSFYKKKRTDISDDFFVRTPLEKFSRKEIDDRHGEHIACDTDDI